MTKPCEWNWLANDSDVLTSQPLAEQRPPFGPVCLSWIVEMTTFSQQRKPLDKILELGKETGWVIAYEPDTKEFGGGSFETLNWESNGRCWMMDV